MAEQRGVEESGLRISADQRAEATGLYDEMSSGSDEALKLAFELVALRPLPRLLLEARDALPAISLASAKLHNLDLTLADRIERALEPWRIPDEVPQTDEEKP